MLIIDQHPHNKSIMVSVLGLPNVGKSSLINELLGTDLSIVTNKPQTTRNHFHCVLNVDRTEIVLVDTPGVHKSTKEFNRRMNQEVCEGINGVDLNLLLVDLSRDIINQFKDFREGLDIELGPTWVVFSKLDLMPNIKEELLKDVFESMKSLIPSLEKFFMLSSRSGDRINELVGAICDRANPGPHLYPRGEISNKTERFFVTEYIREQAFIHLKEELPYETAVIIDEYRDMENQSSNDDVQNLRNSKKKKNSIVSHISASIIVNKPSQRAIVVGAKGSIIKKIGIGARKKIEAMVGGQIHLNLHVKVVPNWFKNNTILEDIGLYRSNATARAWRQK